MIKYALQCTAGHAFEGWFGGSADYDDQAARGLIECPVCGAAQVSKQIMAPAVTGLRSPPQDAAKLHEMMMQAAEHVRSHVEAHFDYMGDAFADEARAIHEGASEARGIYGEATAAQVESLERDGVRVAPLPPPPPRKTQVN